MSTVGQLRCSPLSAGHTAGNMWRLMCQTDSSLLCTIVCRMLSVYPTLVDFVVFFNPNSGFCMFKNLSKFNFVYGDVTVKTL